MTTLPDPTYVTAVERTVGEKKQAERDVIDVVAELVGAAAESTIVIASGTATPTAGIHSMDTEAQASSDDLTHLDSINHPDGRVLLIRSADAARTVTVKHNQSGAGEILLRDGADLALTGTTKWLLLKRTGPAWEEVMRSVDEGIADDAVTTAKIADDAVTQAKIADDAVGAAQISSGAVGSSELATALNPLGKQTIAVPAGAMTARTNNGAASGTVELSTNKIMLTTFDFDTATNQFLQFRVPMPKGWDEGTVTAILGWSHPSTSTNFGVRWTVRAVAIGNDDAQDVAFVSTQNLTDTGGTTDDLYITAEFSAITIAGSPAEGHEVIFQINRNTGHADDNLAVDARLHWVKILYTIDAASDD